MYNSCCETRGKNDNGNVQRKVTHVLQNKNQSVSSVCLQSIHLQCNHNHRNALKTRTHTHQRSITHGYEHASRYTPTHTPANQRDWQLCNQLVMMGPPSKGAGGELSEWAVTRPFKSQVGGLHLNWITEFSMRACQRQVPAECRPLPTSLTPPGPCHPSTVGPSHLHFPLPEDAMWRAHLHFIKRLFTYMWWRSICSWNPRLIGVRTHAGRALRPIKICQDTVVSSCMKCGNHIKERQDAAAALPHTLLFSNIKIKSTYSSA